MVIGPTPLPPVAKRACENCGELVKGCPHCGAFHDTEPEPDAPAKPELDELARRRRAYRAEWRKEMRPGVGPVLVATFTMPYPKDGPLPGNTVGETARRSMLAYCSAALRSAIKKIGNA